MSEAGNCLFSAAVEGELALVCFALVTNYFTRESWCTMAKTVANAGAS